MFIWPRHAAGPLACCLLLLALLASLQCSLKTVCSSHRLPIRLVSLSIIMPALCNLIAHSVIFFPVVSSSFYLLFSRLSQTGCLPYFYTWCGRPSANLECRSETAARGSLEMQDPKKSPKIRHLGTIRQLCGAISSQLRHLSTIGKKLVKQQYLPHMFLQYGELRLTSG